MGSTNRKRLGIFAAFVALMAGVALLVLVIGDRDGKKGLPDRTSVAIPVDGLDAGTSDDRTITAPKAMIQAVAPKLEDQLREIPAATPPTEIDALLKAEKERRATAEPLPTAGATAGFAGCRTSFVNNQSSRRGIRPIWQVDHYTVSPNVVGWADVNSVVALFNRSSSQASSHFVIDGEGHCAYIVPIENKSWTQAGANAFSIGYEIIATGRESEYLPLAGAKRLAAVQKEVSRRTGIPMRRGSADSCGTGRSGIVQHKDFGICGGGHVDISPFSIGAVVTRTIQLAGGGCSVSCERRKRHAAAHREFRKRRCSPPETTRSERCRLLSRRIAALHEAGVKFS